MSSERFPNVELINKSIRELYRHLSPMRVRQFSNDFEMIASDEDQAIDPLIHTQRIARRLAKHFRVAVSNVVVTFRSDLPVPGRIELSSSLDFFIDLNSQHRNTPHAIAAILAHEVTHIFLHQASIRLEPLFANEVLTDTTAAYLGCGITILHGASQVATHVDGKTLTDSSHFGYITIEEFGYIQAKRDWLFGRTESPLFSSGLAHAGYAYKALLAGQSYFSGERAQSPYSPAKHSRPRYLNRFTRKVSGSSESIAAGQQVSGAMTFPCSCCAQTIRVPVLGKTLSVRCPICDTALRCYT